jgi:hypothetical protein
METKGRKEQVRWVLSWMPDIKVLAPKSLRDRIAEKRWDGLRAHEQDKMANHTLLTYTLPADGQGEGEHGRLGGRASGGSEASRRDERRERQQEAR